MHDRSIAHVLDYATRCPRRAVERPVDKQVIAVVLGIYALLVFVPIGLGTLIIGALLLLGP
jgi:hypothetical protein